MARVTVEDCLDYVENRFELVILAAKRARQIETKGMTGDNQEKPAVIALRQIADGKIDVEVATVDENIDVIDGAPTEMETDEYFESKLLSQASEPVVAPKPELTSELVVTPKPEPTSELVVTPKSEPTSDSEPKSDIPPQTPPTTDQSEDE